jgi:hypothetical protein
MSRLLSPKIIPVTFLLFAFIPSAMVTMAAEAPTRDTQAEEKPSADGAVNTSDAETDPTQPGLWAFLDPESGELREEPTPEQSLWLDAMSLSSLNKSTEDLKTFALEGSGRGVNLSGRFRSALMVQRLPDGSLSMRCTDHPDQSPTHTHSSTLAPIEKPPVEAAEVK